MPWFIAGDSEVLAVHAALLPTGTRGEILYLGGDEHNQQKFDDHEFDHCRVYDCATSLVYSVHAPVTDAFCCGHSLLANGSLLIAGGTGRFGDWVGLRECWIGNRDGWLPARSMAGTRWYPTLVTLSDGRVFCLGGATRSSTAEGAPDDSIQAAELYTPREDRWQTLASFGTRDGVTYPRLHLLPDGRLFSSTRLTYSGSARCVTLDPYTGVATDSASAPPETDFNNETYGYASVLLPLLPGNGYEAHVLLCGGGDGGDNDGAVAPTRAPPHPLRIHAGVDTEWHPTGDRQAGMAARRRRHACAVLLPTGQVMISGGMEDPGNEKVDDRIEVPTREVELYDPGIDWSNGQFAPGEGEWTVGEAASINRNYHSVALLMPDGRVWTAGSNHRAGREHFEQVMEVYKPPYDEDPRRPDIDEAPTSVTYGQVFEVKLKTPAAIERVALMRCGSVTHAFDADQRYVGLEILSVEGEILRVQAPWNRNVAPPGYYMLWVVTHDNLPCNLARFVRVGTQRCSLTLNRSRFSWTEVAARSPRPDAPAGFADAFWLQLYDLLGSEAQPGSWAFELTWDDGSGPVPGMEAALDRVVYGDVRADGLRDLDLFCAVRFTTTEAFDTLRGGTADRRVRLRAYSGGMECEAWITLSGHLYPYMVGSDDLRVLRLRPGEARVGVVQGTAPDAPYVFIQGLKDALDAAPAEFDGLPTDELELATQLDGAPVYNYAVARVRHQAPAGVTALDVRLFFRSFSTMVSWTDYAPAVYPRSGDGPTAEPLLGLAGGEVASIPFLSVPRIDPSGSLADQPVDWPNVRTLDGTGGEVYRFFGCWLDFNTTTPRFPLHPASAEGPFPAAERLSIQELVRGEHQCLVAEIHYPPNPIPNGATTNGHGSLAQLNLSIVESTSPAAHTFLVRPTPDRPYATEIGVVGQPELATALQSRPSTAADEALSRQAEPGNAETPAAGFGGDVGVPDELVIRWNDVPKESVATLFLPDADADEVIQVASARETLEREDEHTLRLRVGGVTHVPIPGGVERSLPGLLTVRLPDSAPAGQEFRVAVYQVSGQSRSVAGSFEIVLASSPGAQALPAAERTLSVLRWVGRAVPEDDPWAAVWVRYLDAHAEKVKRLGGDPDRVLPSADGEARVPTPDPEPDPERPVVLTRGCALLILALVAAVAMLLRAVASRPAVWMGVAAVLLVAAGGWWLARRR